jgi:hypothetical protein
LLESRLAFNVAAMIFSKKNPRALEKLPNQSHCTDAKL